MGRVFRHSNAGAHERNRGADAPLWMEVESPSAHASLAKRRLTSWLLEPASRGFEAYELATKGRSCGARPGADRYRHDGAHHRASGI